MAKKKSKKKHKNKRIQPSAQSAVQSVESVGSAKLPKNQSSKRASKSTFKSKSTASISQSATTKPDLTVVALIAAGICLVLAGFLIWSSYRTNQSKPTESSRSQVSPIPLNDSSDPTQLQSGASDLQSGSGVGSSQNTDSSRLQPQQQLTPDQLKNLQ
ncbi:MAG: hypothetical protein WCO19_03440 [Candidatus Saccharibacteria bacterium]